FAWRTMLRMPAWPHPVTTTSPRPRTCATSAWSPHRARGAGQDHLCGRGRPCSPSARERQGGVVPAEVQPRSTHVREVASGSPLLVDVELGRGHRLYALSQGDFPPGNPEGSPALPNTGALVKASRDGTLTVVIDRLNQPTSLEFIGQTGYVITLGGEI